MLWDYSQLKGPKLVVKLATYYSTSEVLTFKHQEKFEEDEKAGDDALERLRNTVAEEHKEAMDEKDRVILAHMEENERLKQEKIKLEQNMKKPDEATIKSSAENQELEKAKDYYLNKNIEIEQLIQQVMKGDITPPKGMNLPGKSLMDKSPEGIESLLRFLIYLVLHKEKMSPEEYK